MRLGLISDTHDCLPMIRAAVRMLNKERVDLVLHAGDLISPFVIPELSALQGQMVGVFGNNDGDRNLLQKKADEWGRCDLRGNVAVLTLEGVRIILLHGHEPDLMGLLQEGNVCDLLVHGHTHQPGITRTGRTLSVNPGEVCGYLTGTGTIAVLDTTDLEPSILAL